MEHQGIVFALYTAKVEHLPLNLVAGYYMALGRGGSFGDIHA
jgi:hypothetical protein